MILKAKKGKKIVINCQKYGRNVTPGGNRKRAMINRSLPGNSRRFASKHDLQLTIQNNHLYYLFQQKYGPNTTTCMLHNKTLTKTRSSNAAIKYTHTYTWGQKSSQCASERMEHVYAYACVCKHGWVKWKLVCCCSYSAIDLIMSHGCFELPHMD